MGNVIFGMLASPRTHRDIKKVINKWKYKLEGRYFKGEQAPFISEIKFYDIRIPKEIEKEVIRDLNLYGSGTGVCDSWMLRSVMFIYRMFIRLFTPFKPIPYVKGEKQYSLPKQDWYYILPVGILKIKPVSVKGGKDREVL
jgi:hypothetical protein